MDPVIETHGLTKYYGGKAAVNRLDLSVPRGAILALLGDNGAGKSTTIRMLTGLLPPDAGRCTILGRDCWQDAVPLRHQVAYVPEKPRFYDWMTVKETGWFTAGFHRPNFLPRFLDLIEGFGLDPRTRLQNLSKGMYSKVALALALAQDPEVLILDEPTSGLDLLARREFLDDMLRLAGENRTILICSHQIAEVERVASHVTFLSRGRLVLTCTLDDLRQRLVRFRLRYQSLAPDAASLGSVLQRNGTAPNWQAVVLDPDRQAVEALRVSGGISEFEETSLTLEEAYCALMSPEILA
jgi:ABC-2 type transport system ATP-binding protein